LHLQVTLAALEDATQKALMAFGDVVGSLQQSDPETLAKISAARREVQRYRFEWECLAELAEQGR